MPSTMKICYKVYARYRRSVISVRCRRCFASLSDAINSLFREKCLRRNEKKNVDIRLDFCRLLGKLCTTLLPSRKPRNVSFIVLATPLTSHFSLSLFYCCFFTGLRLNTQNIFVNFFFLQLDPFSKQKKKTK